MTNRLYYNDSYMHQFTSRVIERTTHEGHPALVLASTYFYPTGGGQPHDTGSIDGVGVLEVLTRPGDQAVLHVLAAPVERDSVDCAIDWPRRYDLMQQHTGQHVLSQAFIQTCAAFTVGFHLTEDNLTIDLSAAVTPDQLDAAEDLANRVVWDNRPVTARIVPADEAGDVRMRKLPDQIATDGLRIVDIAGFDRTACGGTHVAQTGEIGLIKIMRAEKRGDKTRLEFVCGRRALQDYRLKNALALGLTADLTVGIEEVRPAVSRLQEGYKEAQRALKAASARLLEADATDLLDATPETSGRRLIVQIMDGRDAADARLLASLLTRGEGVIALLAAPTPDRASLVFARSANLSADMNALLKATLERASGKGGGQPALAQGSAAVNEAGLRDLLAFAADQVG